MKGCLKIFAIFSGIGLLVVIGLLIFGGYWCYTRLLSDGPLEIKKAELTLVERQALNVKLLPVQQALTRNKALPFRVRLSAREVSHILQEALDSSLENSYVEFNFQENEMSALFSRRIFMRQYFNLELDVGARVTDGKYQVDLSRVCMDDVCLPDALLGQASHLLEWKLEKRLSSETSPLLINEFNVRRDNIYCKLHTQEVHPFAELEEGATLE
jgi:hypothetical protein